MDMRELCVGTSKMCAVLDLFGSCGIYSTYYLNYFTISPSVNPSWIGGTNLSQLLCVASVCR